MDPTLAALYGTNQPDETEDQEKLAAAALAEGLEEDEAMDLSEVGDDDLEELAQQVLAQNENDEGAEVEEPEEGEEKVAEDEEINEKVAEADYLGRVMAHAYVQELRGIDKEAGVKEVAGKVGRYVHGKASRLGGAILNVGSKKGDKRVSRWTKKSVQKADLKASKGLGGPDVKKHEEAVANRHKAMKGAKKRMGRVVAGTGYAAAGLGATAAGVGAKKAYDKVKESSAFETLALQRAEEMLAESGFEAQQEVTPYDVLATKVEERAAEILQENGYELSDE